MKVLFSTLPSCSAVEDFFRRSTSTSTSTSAELTDSAFYVVRTKNTVLHGVLSSLPQRLPSRVARVCPAQSRYFALDVFFIFVVVRVSHDTHGNWN